MKNEKKNCVLFILCACILCVGGVIVIIQATITPNAYNALVLLTLLAAMGAGYFAGKEKNEEER